MSDKDILQGIREMIGIDLKNAVDEFKKEMKLSSNDVRRKLNEEIRASMEVIKNEFKSDMQNLENQLLGRFKSEFAKLVDQEVIGVQQIKDKVVHLEQEIIRIIASFKDQLLTYEYFEDNRNIDMSSARQELSVTKRDISKIRADLFKLQVNKFEDEESKELEIINKRLGQIEERLPLVSKTSKNIKK